MQVLWTHIFELSGQNAVFSVLFEEKFFSAKIHSMILEQNVKTKYLLIRRFWSKTKRKNQTLVDSKISKQSLMKN